MFDLLFKDLDPDRQLDEARRTRPQFLYNPRREIDVYRDVLSRVQLATPAFFGAAIDERRESERYWLFIECVRGVPLWQCELDLWSAAARWLKRLHSQRFENLPASLLRHDAAYYGRWIERAATFRPELQRIAKHYGRVIDRLTALPATFIHGEFYPSNVLVQEGRIRPVDWETAAVGPGLIDLAALCGGRFDDTRRAQLAAEYGAEMDDLDFCRLHLSIQWLGWSADWKPPKEHAHDWLAEVMSLAWKLGVA
jgi:aminoglycoside phosphotransferase (APT) family kinase protein